MGISNDAQKDVDEFGAASAELKQFPWDQKFIAWEAEARYDLEFRIGSLEQEVYALRRENADLSTRAEKAEEMVELLIELGDVINGDKDSVWTLQTIKECWTEDVTKWKESK